MFCTKCGANLKEDAKFCTKCGNAVKKIEDIKHETKDKKKKISKVPFLAGGGAMALLLVGFLMMYLFIPKVHCGISGHESGLFSICIEGIKCGRCGEQLEPAQGHSWIDATCTSPKTCDRCGNTEGASLEHNWNTEPTCKEGAICYNCGAESEKSNSHVMRPASCVEPATCEICGYTEGKASAEHFTEYGDSKCKYCGEKTYWKYISDDGHYKINYEDKYFKVEGSWSNVKGTSATCTIKVTPKVDMNLDWGYARICYGYSYSDVYGNPQIPPNGGKNKTETAELILDRKGNGSGSYTITGLSQNKDGSGFYPSFCINALQCSLIVD